MSEDNTAINKKEELTTVDQKPLFTHEERESFVRKFIDAWNTRQVWIEFPKSTREKSEDPLMDLIMLSSMTYSKPSEENLNTRERLRNKIDDEIKIVSGSVPATPEVIYKTVDELYNDIVDMQTYGLLKGTFLTNEMENRVYGRVMEKVDKYIEKTREELGLNDI